jgi:hypothetical protein
MSAVVLYFVLIVFFIEGPSTMAREAPSAFCALDGSHLFDLPHHHPLGYPEIHIPWLWDAYFDESTNIVELISLSKHACHLNLTAWNNLLQLFPEYSAQLAGGLHTNVLINTDDRKKFNELKSLIASPSSCNFYSGNRKVYTTVSLKLRISGVSASTGTVLLKCPAPPNHVHWDRVSLERNTSSSSVLSGVSVLFGSSTPLVPVCRDGHFPRTTAHTFGLSACTTVKSASRVKLVEWLEYHLLQGRFCSYLQLH